MSDQVRLSKVPKVYGVCSPEYETHRGGEFEPPEFGCEWLTVIATSKREAITVGVRFLRQRNERGGYFDRGWDAGYEPPWKGFTAEVLEPCIVAPGLLPVGGEPSR